MKTHNIFKDKLDANYENINDFMIRSKIPVSMETVRRFITERRPINVMSLTVICKYLGFTPREIVKILEQPQKYILSNEIRYTEVFAGLIGESCCGAAGDLTDEDKTLLRIRHDIRSANRGAYNLMLENIRYICIKEGVNYTGLDMLITPETIEDEVKNGRI